MAGIGNIQIPVQPGKTQGCSCEYPSHSRSTPEVIIPEVLSQKEADQLFRQKMQQSGKLIQASIPSEADKILAQLQSGALQPISKSTASGFWQNTKLYVSQHPVQSLVAGVVIAAGFKYLLTNPQR